MSSFPGFHGFAEEFRAPGQAVIEPARFATALHLQMQELAQLARVHRATVSEAPTNVRLQRFMRETLQVLSAALEVTGDREGAIYWYRNSPIPQFQHHTAEQLVGEQQTAAVLAYLGAIGNRPTPRFQIKGRTLLDSHTDALAALCRRFAVRQLGLFGSALRSDFDTAHSDIDLAVEFGPPFDGSASSQYFDFKAELEQLLGHRVDLVELTAMPDSRLRLTILRTQVPLYTQEG